MRIAACALIALVGLIHVYILTLEMFLWRTRALKVFRMTAEKAETTAVMAQNQGLYNGFLAAGLAWGLWLGAAGHSVQLFFLACVIVAGAFGAITVSRKILWVQALPALLAAAAVLWG